MSRVRKVIVIKQEEKTRDKRSPRVESWGSETMKDRKCGERKQARSKTLETQENYGFRRKYKKNTPNVRVRSV